MKLESGKRQCGNVKAEVQKFDNKKSSIFDFRSQKLERGKQENMKGLMLEVGFSDPKVWKPKVWKCGSREAKSGKTGKD